jgi:hypothetical protein
MTKSTEETDTEKRERETIRLGDMSKRSLSSVATAMLRNANFSFPSSNKKRKRKTKR